jgi:hypothetical protein
MDGPSMFKHKSFVCHFHRQEPDQTFDYSMARARELANDEVLSTMFDQVLDGESDKQKIYA